MIDGCNGGNIDILSINTINYNSEGEKTQKEVNETNKEAIDDLINNNMVDTDHVTYTVLGNTSTEAFGDFTQADEKLYGESTNDTVVRDNTLLGLTDGLQDQIDGLNTAVNNLGDIINNAIGDIKASLDSLSTCTDCSIDPFPSAIIDNIVPTDPTTEDGNGTVSFDVDLSDCNGTSTAVLNPASGTEPITLSEGINTGLTFTDLPPGYYNIEVYCDTELIDNTSFIINDYDSSEDGGGDEEIIDIVTPDDGSLIPPNSNDIPVNDGEDFNHILMITKGNLIPENNIQCYQNLFIVGSDFNLNEWTTGCLNSFNPNDPQGDECYVAIKRTSDNTFDTTRESVSNSVKGLNWIKAIDNITITKILENGAFGYGDKFVLNEDYTNYDLIISKWYFNTSAGTAVKPQYGYPIREISDLIVTNTWLQKQHGSNVSYSGELTFTDTLNGTVTKARASDFLATIWGVNGIPAPIDLNAQVSGTIINMDDYSNADFLLINCTYADIGNTQLMYAKDIVYDGTTRYDFVGIGACYFSFNVDKTINIIDAALSAEIIITSIKKIIL